jgi:hypothetical protein
LRSGKTLSDALALAYRAQKYYTQTKSEAIAF